MRNMPKLALWLLLSATVIGTAVLPASAGFYHPYGLLMSTYPQQVLVFWADGDQSVQLIVIISPPWYFVEDLYAFDTVRLTVTLRPSTLQATTPPMELLGGQNGGCLKSSWEAPATSCSTVTAQWTNVAVGQDEYGAIEGGYLLYTITFVINPDGRTARGYYYLYLRAEATAGDVLFAGWVTIGVSVRPGHIPIQLGT